MNKLNCYNIHKFNYVMHQKKFNIDGSNLPENIAVISICEPEENRGITDDINSPFYYPDHYFNKSTYNILNIDFDDIDGDAYYWNNCYRTIPDNFIIHQGQVLKQLTDTQALTIVNFIINNIGKNFFIHCYAGISRSKAVIKFIVDNFDNYSYEDCKEWTDNEIPNLYVLKKLNNAYYKIKNNIET